MKPLKLLQGKKKNKGGFLQLRKAAATEKTISTESCSQSLSSPLCSPANCPPAYHDSDNTNTSNAAMAVTKSLAVVDDGAPSHSALNDLHRTLKLIEAERHLCAHRLYLDAKERIIGNKTSSMDTSLASARSFLKSRHHEFSTLEKRGEIFGTAQINTCASNAGNNCGEENNTVNTSSSNNESAWILAQTHFGITTYYRREPIDNSLSIKIEGEINDENIPLFEQIVVLRECDLYHTWAPFMIKSRKLAQLDKLDVVAWYEVGVPLLGLMRDACYRAVGCDCMKEDGRVLLVAVGLNDSEEHGVKNALNSNCNSSNKNKIINNNRYNSETTGGGGEEERGSEMAGAGDQRRRSFAEHIASITTDSNLVTDTAASSFLARDEILETIEIPPIPTGLGRGRMTIRNFAASIDVLGPSSARTCLVVNVDPNLHFLPQAFIDFAMKKMAGVMILKLQHAAKRVVADPITNPHARRMREDVSFYRDWLLPRFQRHCDDLGWEMPPVKALEVSEEELRAEGVYESWRSEVDSSSSNHNATSNPSRPSTSSVEENAAVDNSSTRVEGVGESGASFFSQISRGSKSKFAKLVQQLRHTETTEEKIAAARLRAAKLLKPEPLSDSRKMRLRELKGIKRKAEDRLRANNDEASCDEQSVSTALSFQMMQRWDDQSGLKKSLGLFTITFLLNVVLPYFSSDKFLSSLSATMKLQIISFARESVPLFFICLQAISLRALVEFVLIFAFDWIDFGQRKMIQNMDFGRKLYHAEVRKYSSITAIAVVASSCGMAFLRFVFEEMVLLMCSSHENEKDWSIICDKVSKVSWSCGQLGLAISTFITTRLGIFVSAVLLMASIVLPKPEQARKSERLTARKSTRSISSRMSIQDDLDAGSSSVVSASSTSGGRDIPDTIGGANLSFPLSICGTFSLTGSTSMEVIEEGEE